ncbi:hypothetical protein ACP70R_032670 [Stipagrostis hirtigluma subsp. patula]
MDMVGVPSSGYGWAGVWSTAASLLFMWSMVQQHLPFQLDELLSALSRRLLSRVAPYVTITIDEHAATYFGYSGAYLAAEAYLGDTCAGRASSLRDELADYESDRVSLALGDHEEVVDDFRGARMWSTMVAAMANFLEYDVYDLELTAVKSNTQLRKLFIETTAKSIIVIEDIDCSIDLTGKRKKKKKASDDGEEKEGSKVTLSGLLNVVDGLWSACGGERIIVFTTNHKEKLDPALIRRGRMDMHIEMSYCCFEGFKVLASNYLGVAEHELFGDIRQLLEEVDMTPADVAENLMPRSKNRDVDGCLNNLVKALKDAKEEASARALAKKDDHEGRSDENSGGDDNDSTTTCEDDSDEDKEQKYEED